MLNDSIDFVGVTAFPQTPLDSQIVYLVADTLTHTKGLYVFDGMSWVFLEGPEGGGATGDMLSAVFDPQGINADVFSRLNHTGALDLGALTASTTALPTEADHLTNKAYVDGLTNYDAFDRSIVPAADITYDLGSPTKMWKDIYVGPGSLYVNGQKVLEENAGTIIISADLDQNVQIRTGGSGDIEFLPSGSGAIDFKGNLSIQGGKNLMSGDGMPISNVSGFTMNGESIKNLADPVDLADAATKEYVDNSIIDPTGAVVKAAYEGEPNTNAFTDADVTKLSGIEPGATGDQTAVEILNRIKTVDGDGSGLNADLLDGQQITYFAVKSDTYTKSEIDALHTAIVDGIDWKEAVADFSDLATTYPDAVEGWTASVNNEDTIYRHNGISWISLANGTVPLATAALDGKMSSSDFTKLQNIEANATADQTASEILTLIKVVHGIGSGIDAELLGSVSYTDYITRTESNPTLKNGVVVSGVDPTIYFDETDVANGDAQIKSSNNNLYIQGPTGGNIYLSGRASTNSGYKVQVAGSWYDLLHTLGNQTILGNLNVDGSVKVGQSNEGLNLSSSGHITTYSDTFSGAHARGLSSAIGGDAQAGLGFFGSNGSVSSINLAVNPIWYTAANGLNITTSTLKWKNNDVIHAGGGQSISGNLTATTFIGSLTGTASNADKLDNLDSSAFLRTTGKAADSNLLDGIDSASFLRSDVDDTLTSAIVVPTGNRDEGIFGTYDSTKTQHIWSMGTQYRNNAAGTNFGSLYGLAYKHTNNGTGGAMAGGHQAVWCQGGNGTSAMGTNLWTSGIVYEQNQALSLRYAALNHNHTFASLSGKPTTLAGFGITDAAALSHNHPWSEITSQPTTLSGTVNLTGDQTVAGSKRFNTASNTTPLRIARGATSSEEVAIGLDDASARFVYTNDEAFSSMRFRLINTDTETGGGVSASDYEMVLSATPSSFTLSVPGDLSFTGSLTGGTVPWARLSDVPTTFPPDSHTHNYAASSHTHTSTYLGLTAQAADSAKLGGLALSAGRNNGVNQVCRTNTQGYTDFGWITTTSGNTTGTITDIYVNTNDGFIRKATKAHVLSQLGVLSSSGNQTINGELTIGGSSVSGAEGGQINLSAPPNSGTTIPFLIDAYNNSVRIGAIDSSSNLTLWDFQAVSGGAVRTPVHTGGGQTINSGLTVEGPFVQFQGPWNTAGTYIGSSLKVDGGHTGYDHPYLDLRRWTGSASDHHLGSIEVSPVAGGGMYFYCNASSTNDKASVERMRIQENGHVVFSNNIYGKDIIASRGDGTGALYLNSVGTRYLYWNNSFYHLNGAGLVVNGMVSATGFSPFTGSHQGLTDETFSASIGDIVVDGAFIASSDVSNTISMAEVSSTASQKTAIGVLSELPKTVSFDPTDETENKYTNVPAAMSKLSDIEIDDLLANNKVILFNAVGEGMINVIGEGGDIEAGDYIVTSSTAGKGMKQADDIQHNYTVAKARQSVTFTNASEEKQIACVYMCG